MHRRDVARRRGPAENDHLVEVIVAAGRQSSLHEAAARWKSEIELEHGRWRFDAVGEVVRLSCLDEGDWTKLWTEIDAKLVRIVALKLPNS